MRYFLLNRPQSFTKLSLGFSLIELIVVIAIIGILTAAGFTAYSSYASGQKVDSVAQEFVTILEEARSKALNKEASGNCIDQNQRGFTVRFCPKPDPNPAIGCYGDYDYEFIFTCGGVNDRNRDEVIRTVTLPQGISLHPTLTNQRRFVFMYDSIYVKYWDTATSSFQIINDNSSVVFTDGNKTRTVKINSVGAISLQ
jgi:prepilin-type N-terminal cleavage/methylation domain-containing protein